MHPLLLFFLGIMLPLTITLILVTPIYLGIFVALYIQYSSKAWAIFFDFGRVVDSYGKLYDFHSQNAAAMNFMDHTLPILGPPIAGILITLFLMYAFGKYVANIFVLSS